MKKFKARIGIWHCSSPTDSKKFKRGLRRLRDKGLDPVVPAATLKWAYKAESRERPYLAGPDADKVKAFWQLWRDYSIDDVFAVRGGYGTLRLLEHLDKLPLEKFPPKRIWGFSDLTCVQNYLYARLGASWVHSPMLRDAPPRSAPTLQKLKVVERGKKAWRGTKRAPILGGNLMCYVSLAGTPWMPKPKRPFFLAFEDIDEEAYRLDRLLVQLSRAGALKNCLAVILGEFAGCHNYMPVLRKWATEEGVTLLTGLAIGHVGAEDNRPLAMGVPVELEIKGSRAQLRLPELSLGC